MPQVLTLVKENLEVRIIEFEDGLVGATVCHNGRKLREFYLPPIVNTRIIIPLPLKYAKALRGFNDVFPEIVFTKYGFPPAP